MIGKGTNSTFLSRFHQLHAHHMCFMKICVDYIWLLCIILYIYINFKCIQNMIFDTYRIYNFGKIYFIHNVFFETHEP